MSSTTFVNRDYTCKCGHRGKAYCVVADIRDIKSNYHQDDVPSEVNPKLLYKEVLVRDEYGIISSRRIEPVGCEHCGELDIDVFFPMKLDDILNFYPPSENQKWLEGFIKQVG